MTKLEWTRLYYLKGKDNRTSEEEEELQSLESKAALAINAAMNPRGDDGELEPDGRVKTQITLPGSVYRRASDRARQDRRSFNEAVVQGLLLYSNDEPNSDVTALYQLDKQYRDPDISPVVRERIRQRALVQSGVDLAADDDSGDAGGDSRKKKNGNGSSGGSKAANTVRRNGSKYSKTEQQARHQQYLDGGGSKYKTLEQWDALSDEHQDKLLAKADKHLKGPLEIWSF